MGNESLVTRGRYQPFGNHHFAVSDYFMDKHDADELNIVTEGLSGERTPTSPFYGDEVAEMIGAAFDQDYDVDYEVNVVCQNEVFDDNVFALLEDDPVYFTREDSHAKAFGFLELLYDLAFWNDSSIEDVDYEPRTDMTPFERVDLPVETSSTSIREMIDQSDDDWRKHVSDPVEDMIDEKDEARRVMGEEPEDGKYVSIVKNFLI